MRCVLSHYHARLRDCAIARDGSLATNAAEARYPLAKNYALRLVGFAKSALFRVAPDCPTGSTITALTYAEQLQKLANALGEKRPRRLTVQLLHHNARV